MTHPDDHQDELPAAPDEVGIIEDKHQIDKEVDSVTKKTMAEKVRSGYKAITAFVATLAGFLTLIVSDEQIRNALPENATAWLIVVGIPAVVGLGTWLKRNEYTVDEAIKILNRAQERAGK